MQKTKKPPVWKCKRCGASWEGRKAGKPVRCPRCTSPYWDKPRQKR